jgi:hypothetical protein
MKKLLGIIVLSLLLSGNAFADAPLKTSLDKLLKSFKGGELIKIPSFTATPWPNEAVSILMSPQRYVATQTQGCLHLLI